MICDKCGWNDHGTGDMAHTCAVPDGTRRFRLEILHDPIAEKLDEMADLCEHWKRNRSLGRNPTAIRAALLMLAQECIALTTANAEITGG